MCFPFYSFLLEIDFLNRAKGNFKVSKEQNKLLLAVADVGKKQHSSISEVQNPSIVSTQLLKLICSHYRKYR